MKRIAVLLALALCAIPAFQPARAVQGTGVGTLPRTGVVRRSGLLDQFSTVSILADTGARALIVSTHENESQLVANPSSPDNPAVKTVTWRSRHSTFTLTVPEWLSEQEDGAAGEQRFEARFARMVTDEQAHFPPDGT